MVTDPEPIDEIHVDLHGLLVSEVAKRIHEELRRAHRGGIARVIFIHGVGNHSEGGVSEVAKRAREYLKSTAATPRSVIQKLEFGEQTKDLGSNPGLVRAVIALEIPPGKVRLGPRPPRAALGEPDRKALARRAARTVYPEEEPIVRAADEEMKRRFGNPGTRAPYRPADPSKGEWPGQF